MKRAMKYIDLDFVYLVDLIPYSPLNDICTAVGRHMPQCSQNATVLALYDDLIEEIQNDEYIGRRRSGAARDRGTGDK